MTKLVVDAALRHKLGELREELQFTDESGRVLGHFVPASARSRLEPQISDNEIDRRLKQGGGRTLAEIMEDLEKRK